MTEEEYYRRMQQLYDDKANENLVREMSQRYAQMDYDLVDSFQLQITTLILNGELTKADSLLNTRGNILNDIETLNNIRKANEEEKKALDTRESTLDSSTRYEQWKRQDLVRTCSNKVLTFTKLQQYDSVAFYLMQKAEIDSSVVEWQLEAALFLSDTMEDYHKALLYCQRALRHSLMRYGADHLETAACYQYVGKMDEQLADYCPAIAAYIQARDIFRTAYGSEHETVKTLTKQIDRLSQKCKQ